MKFQVSKGKILQAVNIVKQAVANRTTNPILKTILVEANEDGWLILRATNNILDISAMIQAEIEEPGRVCISDLVIDLLPTFEDGKYEDNKLVNPVKFALKDMSLTVTQGKRKHRPVVMSSDKFPKKIEIEGYQELATEDTGKLIEAFQRLQISVGVTEDRRILQGFHFNPHLKMMVTGDGTRVSLRENIELPGNIANPPAKLIMSVLSNLTGLGAKDKLEIKTGPNPPAQGLVAFRGTQVIEDSPYLKWEVIVNSLDGEYPTKPGEIVPVPVKLVQENLAKNPVLEIIVNREVLSKILAICKIYSDRAFNEGKSTHVTLIKNGNGVVFSMHIPDLVEMEEPLECKIVSKEDDFKFLFHPGMCLEALGAIKAEDILLKFYEEVSPFIIQDGTDFTYLQAAMKSSKKEVKNDTSESKLEGTGTVVSSEGN